MATLNGTSSGMELLLVGQENLHLKHHTLICTEFPNGLFKIVCIPMAIQKEPEPFNSFFWSIILEWPVFLSFSSML